MQNNKDLEKEIKNNSNTVFMSEALDDLLSFEEIKNKNSIDCKIITKNSTTIFSLTSKETIEDLLFITFSCNIDSIILLEKEDIDSICIDFNNETIKSFNNDEYSYS